MQKTFLIALVSVLIAAAAYCIGKIPHDFSDSECEICHVQGKKGRENGKYSSMTNSCLTCHTTLYDDGYMHPVDIKAKKVQVPADFPLSPQGKVTCNTCHDVHASYETPFGTKSNFLRRYETGKAFCDICHLNSRALASGHNMVFQSAHMNAEYTVTDPTSTIDPMSRNCISCHDGSFASYVEVKAGEYKHSQDFLKFDQGGKHPIGMHYEQIRQTNRKAQEQSASK